MFSVIIPLYNKENHILKAVESVLKQTFLFFELIVIDDGSTDNGIKKILHVSDYRLTILKQKNSGVSSARNTGVFNAKNQYILFLDADDWWDIHYLEELKILIKKYPNSCLYSTGFYIVKNGSYQKSRAILEKGFHSEPINYFETYIKTFNQFIFPSNSCIPKHIFELYGGFNIHITHGEDFHFWTKIAIKHPIIYLNKHLTYYNQDVNPENQASKNLPSIKNNYISYFNEFIDAEKNDKNLKILLDHIRVVVGFRYKKCNIFINEVNDILKNVDFSKQSTFNRVLYSSPLILFKVLFSFRNFNKRISRLLNKLN